MVKKTKIERGDIVWLDFSPTKGHEQAGLRPAIVISPTKYNILTGLALVCPITKQEKGYFFEVPVSGLQFKSAALVDQLRSVDIKERITKKTGRISDEEMMEILARLDVLVK